MEEYYELLKLNVLSDNIGNLPLHHLLYDESI